MEHVGAERGGEGHLTIPALRGAVRTLRLGGLDGEVPVSRLHREVALAPEEERPHRGVRRRVEPPGDGAEPSHIGAAHTSVGVPHKAPHHRPIPVEPRHPLRHGVVFRLQRPPPRAACLVRRLEKPPEHPPVHPCGGGLSVGEAPQVLPQELVNPPPPRLGLMLHNRQGERGAEPVFSLGLLNAHDGREPPDPRAHQRRHAQGAQRGHPLGGLVAEQRPQRLDGEIKGGGEGPELLPGLVCVEGVGRPLGLHREEPLAVPLQEGADRRPGA